MKKCLCQQNFRGVSGDSYIFWVFFRYNFVNFHQCRICVRDFRKERVEGGGGFLPLPPPPPRPPPPPHRAPPPSVSSPEKAHLNKLKLTSPRKKAPLFLVQLCILVLKTINSKRIEYVVHYVNRVIQVTNVQLFLIFKHVRKF